MTKITKTDAYPLNAEQLGLLFNLPYYAALYLFKEPLTSSEVARRLQVPANVMHYRVKRLHDVGLLEIIDDSTRSRTYKSVAGRFLLSPEVFLAVAEALPAMLDGMLGKLHRNLLQRIETGLRDTEALLENGPVEFELNESLTLGATKPHEYPVCTSISTVDLSAEQFQKVTEAVSAILSEVQADKGEKRCTLAFLAFRGQGAM